MLAMASGPSRLVRHSGGTRVQTNADGSRWVTLSRDGAVHLLELHGRAPQTVWSASPDPQVSCVGLSADGTRVAVGTADGDVVTLDVRDGSELDRASVHGRPIYDLQWLEQGRRLLSASRDNTVQVLGVDPEGALTPLIRLRGHNNYVHAITSDPARDAIYTGSGDGTIRVWRAE
jgi:WD40 repeat protein